MKKIVARPLAFAEHNPWPKNEFGENELERILYLGIPESTENYEALRRGAAKAIKKLMLELVGKDEDARWRDSWDELVKAPYFRTQEQAEKYYGARNDLRAELRQKVEAL